MALYATLLHTIECPACGHTEPAESDFRLGNCGDLPRYQLGERVDWGGERAGTFGRPEWADDCVLVGYPAPCARCATARLTSIVLARQRFVDARARHAYGYEPEDLFVGPERRGLGELTRTAPWRLPRGRASGRALEWHEDRLLRIDGRPVQGEAEYLIDRDPARRFALMALWWLWLEAAAIELDAQRDDDGRVCVTVHEAPATTEGSTPVSDEESRLARAVLECIPLEETLLAEHFARAVRGPLAWSMAELDPSPALRGRVARSFELLQHEAPRELEDARETARVLRYALELPFLL